MAKSRKYELGVGCLLVGAAIVLAFMALQVGAISGLGDRVDVTARFGDAAGLQPGAAVAISGVQIGTVDALTLEGGLAVVQMRLDPGARVEKDDLVRIRARSVLGEKYVEVVSVAGEGVPAEDGDVLVAVGDQVEIDELVAMMGPLVQALDPETLGRVIEKLSVQIEQDPELIGRMLSNADRLIANAALASEELPEAIAEGRSTLSQTRSALGEVRDRAREGKDVMARADRVLADVEMATADLPQLVAKIEGTVDGAHDLTVSLSEHEDEIELIIGNLQQIDKYELRRLLREEGILVRLFPREVDPDAPDEFHRKGKIKR